VGDLVDGILRGAYYDEAIGEEFNLASGHETRIIDLAHMVNKLTGNSAGISFTERRRWDTKSRLLASTKKANALMGYKPEMEFEQGLMNTIEWFKENWEKIEEAARFAPGMSAAVRGYSSVK